MAGHLTAEERDRIAQLHSRGESEAEIARLLHRHRATISRELRRNRSGESYFACQAQESAERRRQDRPLQRKMDHSETNEFVRQGLVNYWSPDQIAGRLNLEYADQPDRHVSPQTIYTWIEQDSDREHWKTFLRRRGKRTRRTAENIGDNHSASTIENRPEVVETRQRLGDFEGDTVLGGPGCGGVITLVDRASRLTIMSKISCKKAEHVRKKIRNRLLDVDDDQRHSITFDNGTEFAECHRLEEPLGITLYFAQPGCPQQRGTNENTNGLIRQFFPKGTDFRDISHQEVKRVENLINDRPRACLGYRTPNEAFHTNEGTNCCD